MIGYCVKCRAKKEIKDGQKVSTQKGRFMLKGVCPDCGTGASARAYVSLSKKRRVRKWTNINPPKKN